MDSRSEWGLLLPRRTTTVSLRSAISGVGVRAHRDVSAGIVREAHCGEARQEENERGVKRGGGPALLQLTSRRATIRRAPARGAWRRRCTCPGIRGAALDLSQEIRAGAFGRNDTLLHWREGQ